MLLQKQRRFIACESDPTCVTDAMLQRNLHYVRQMLSNEADIDGEKEVHCFTEVYGKPLKENEVWKRFVVLKVPEGLCRTQMFSVHMPYHQSTNFGEKRLFRKAKNTSAKQWSYKWRERLNTNDTRSLLLLNVNYFFKEVDNPT